MNDSLSRDSGRTEPNVTAATWVGLFIALFGILIVRWAVVPFYPAFSFTATLWKESLIWLCVIALFFIIRRGERLPLRSIGLGTAPVKNSILWGGILIVLCGLIGSVVAGLTHFRGGETGKRWQSSHSGWSFSSSCAPAWSRSFSIADTLSNDFNCLE